MNTNADIERLAALAPVRDDDLVDAAQSAEARALLVRILASTAAPAATHRNRTGRRRRRRWLAMPAVIALAVAAVAVAVSSNSHGTPNAAAAPLQKVAAVAGAQAPLVLGHGQYVYTRSVNAYAVTTARTDGAAAFTVLVPHVREIWLGPEGGRLHETSGTPQFPTPQDRERWIAAGRPSLSSPPSETTLPPTQPLDLPADPDALYQRLEQDAEGRGSGVHTEMFTLIGDSLRETGATPAQRAALYQVAARLPGVQLLGQARDSAGRSGIAVAMDDQGIRYTLIFDPFTSKLLAEEQLALDGNGFGYPANQRVGYATYLAQKIVDSDTATS